MAEILIRSATVEDTAQILGVHVASIRELCATAYAPEVITAWVAGKRAENYLPAITEHPFFVAVVNDVVVGFSELAPVESEVRAVYVKPDLARSGVGKRLLAAVEEAARGEQLSHLWLDASLNSVDFYVRQGFVVEAEGTVSLTRSIELPCLRLHKRLIAAPTIR